MKSNLSSPTLFPFSPKKSPGNTFWVTDNFLQLYLHITNSDNKSTIKIHLLFLLILLQPTRERYQKTHLFKSKFLLPNRNHISVSYTTPTCGMDPVTRHASDHIPNWCLYQLTFINDNQILYNIFLYLMTASLKNPVHDSTMNEHLKNVMHFVKYT